MNSEEMISHLLIFTRFGEEYLRGLSVEELKKLYKERVKQ